jgi:spore germination protein YaaH
MIGITRRTFAVAWSLALSAALSIGAAGPSSARESTARRASACLGHSARSLHLVRLSGPRARLSWRAPGGSASSAGALYRVKRAGRTVGQTTGSSLVLKIVPGRSTSYSVQILGSGASCSATLRTTLAFRPPGQVVKVRIVSRNSKGVVLGWRRAGRGDAPVEGYRVMRDGEVVGQTRRLQFKLTLSGGRSHRVDVMAVDTRGHLGAASHALLVGAHPGASTSGAAPSTPEALSVSEVSESGARVWWIASRPGAARIVGYRVYRDGKLVGQSAQTSMLLGNLSYPHTYAITVTAIDANKRESPATAPLSLSTSHTAPEGPTLLAAESVTDTSATLSWNAGTANGGSLVGYELFKDGEEVGIEHGQTATVTLASSRSYVFTVRALDSRGYLSAPAPNLTVVTTHTPPSTPSGLSATGITSGSAHLSWSPSTAVSGNIVGYRVFRDGVPVGQTSTPETTLEGLAPSSTYEITVTAVDSLGAISPPTAPLSVHTLDPTPTHGNVQAFLLASTDQSFHDLEAHYQQVGVVYPTYFNCGVGGEVTGKDDPLVTGWASARKIEVLPRLNCQNVNDENQILNEPAAQERTINELSALCEANGYQGIQIDFEGAQPNERNPFTAFITALAARLHAHGQKLSTIVTAKYYNVPTGRAALYDDAALSAVSDYLPVLDWGLHWTTSGPGSMDEYAWFKKVAEYTATLPNKSKFILSMPMYGIDWANGGGAANPGTPLEYANIVALESELGVTPEWDATALSPHFSYTDGVGAHHEVWYTNQRSIGARSELARSLGLGVGLWRLGEEDQSVWELESLGGSS